MNDSKKPSDCQTSLDLIDKKTVRTKFMQTVFFYCENLFLEEPAHTTEESSVVFFGVESFTVKIIYHCKSIFKR